MPRIARKVVRHQNGGKNPANNAKEAVIAITDAATMEAIETSIVAAKIVGHQAIARATFETVVYLPACSFRENAKAKPTAPNTGSL